MSKYENNLVVIGAGSAGLIASLVGSTANAKVVLVESHQMGGDCLYTGCVPSKTLIASAKVAHSIRHAQAYGLTSQAPDVDFPRVMQRIRDAIARIEPNDSAERYTELGVECIHGRGKLVDPHRIVVNGNEISTRSIVLAIGAEPQIPPVPGLRDVEYLTSENLWNIDQLPDPLVVIGGGPIGCELAQAFARLGSRVSIVEQLERLLPLEDQEASELITNTLVSEGVAVYTGYSAVSCDATQLTVKRAQSEEVIPFDRLLVATGRTPRGSNMGLEEVGVNLNENRRIAVNDYLQTSVPSIYACGDVVGPYLFTHMASQQGWYAAMNALLRPFWRFKFDTRIVPWSVFTDPEVARVGLGEAELIEKDIPFEATKYEFDHSDRAIAEGDTKGFVKLFTKPKSDQLLGACIVGANAGDLIISCINAMTHGYGVNKVLSTLHVYPTRTEAIRFASGLRRRKHIPKHLSNLARNLNSLMR